MAARNATRSGAFAAIVAMRCVGELVFVQLGIGDTRSDESVRLSLGFASYIMGGHRRKRGTVVNKQKSHHVKIACFLKGCH
jgi:hypothetical protein